MLEATWRVIARRGLERTTVRDIAREAGYSTGVLAHYFRDKDEILRLALDYAHDQVRARSTLHRQEKTGLAVLRAVLAESLPLDYQRQLEITLEVSNWARAIAETSLRASQHGDYDRWHGVLVELVEGAKQAGDFPADLPTDDAAEMLQCFVDGLSVDALLYPERLGPDRVEALLDLQLNALGARTQLRPPARAKRAAVAERRTPRSASARGGSR